MPGQDARLPEGELRDPELLFQQRMRQLLLLALLIRRYDQLAPRVCELHRPTLADAEVLRPDLVPVHQRHRQPVGQPGAELLHQVQRQRRTVGAFRMEEPDKRIEANTGQRRDAIMPHQRVEKRQQTIDPIPWRTAAPAREAKVLPLLLQQQAEYLEIRDGAHALSAPQTIQRPGLAQTLRRPPAKLLNLARQRISRRRYPGAFIGGVRLPPSTQQRVAAVLELAGDDLPRNRRALARVIGS